MAHKEPMSLEDLPQHLKSVRAHGETGSAPVVGMGQIIVPKKSFGWTKALFAMIMFMTLSIGGLVTYNAVTPQHLTVIVGLEQSADPSQTISRIVSDSGGEIIAVKQKEDSVYEVKVSTHKSKNSFLEWLRKDKDVKKASLED